MAGSEARWGGAGMSAQEPESRKNFIAILSDKVEEPRPVESVEAPAKSASLVSRIFLSLIAIARNRAAKAK
jgi:hypothetical protein